MTAVQYVPDPGHAERARLHAVEAGHYRDQAERAARRAVAVLTEGNRALALVLTEHAAHCAQVAAGEWHSAAVYGGLTSKHAMSAKWAAGEADEFACGAANATADLVIV